MPEKNQNQTAESKPCTESNAGPGEHTDKRGPWDWPSKYPLQAKREIFCEGLFLMAVLFSSFFIILATWREWYCIFLSVPASEVRLFKIIVYYTAAGLMGGVTFSIKMFYRMVARGYWHQDRRSWRLMTPFVAMAVAFIIGQMKESSLISANIPTSGSAAISIGFLAGYFADQAVAKMYEIAEVLFGKSSVTKGGDGH